MKKKFLTLRLSVMLVVLCMVFSAIGVTYAAGNIYCRVGDDIDGVDTSQPGVQTVGGNTVHVGVPEVMFYNTFDDKTDGTNPGTLAQIASGGNGWVKLSSETRPLYKALDNEIVSAFNITAADVAKGQDQNLGYYTFKKDSSLTGQFAVELKIRTNASVNANLRFLNAVGDGWQNANQMVYSFLEFVDSNLTFFNITRNASNTTDNRATYQTAVSYNEWVTVRYEFDTDAETFDLYVNGALLADDLGFYVKDIPDSLRTPSQKTVNLAYMRVGNSKINNVYTVAEFLLDDIAVYKTASSTTHYFGSLSGIPKVFGAAGAPAAEQKISVDIQNASGGATGMKASVPIKASKIDSSMVGDFRARISGYSQTAPVEIKKRGTPFTQDFQGSYSTGSGHTVEPESVGSENNVLQIYKNVNFNTLDPGFFANGAGAPFKTGFRFKFPVYGDLSDTGAGGYFTYHLSQDNSNPIVEVNIWPARNRMTVVSKGGVDANGDAFSDLNPGTLWPAPVWSSWNSLDFLFKDGQVEIYLNNQLLRAQKIRVDIDFGLIRFAQRPNAIVNSENATTHLDDFYAFRYFGVSGVDDAEYTTALGSLDFPTTMPTTLGDGSKNKLPVKSLTPLDGEITAAGTYQYTVSVEGSDETATLGLHVLALPFSVSAPAAAGSTVTVPVTKLVDGAAGGTLILAVYNGGLLTRVIPETVSASGSYVFEGVPAGEMKAFLWESIGSPVPLASFAAPDLP